MSCCHQKIARLESNVHALGKYHHEAWPLRQGADGYAGVLAVAASLAHMRPQASPCLVPVAPLALLVKFSTLLFHRSPHDTYNCSKLLPWTPQYQTYIAPCMAALPDFACSAPSRPRSGWVESVTAPVRAEVFLFSSAHLSVVPLAFAI